MCAAHCKQSTNSWTAGAGSATRSRQRQTKSGRSQLAHPSYNSRTIDYDYMVLTVSGSFSYDNYVKPIKLVNTSSANENTGTCTTSGYGYSQVKLIAQRWATSYDQSYNVWPIRYFEGRLL